MMSRKLIGLATLGMLALILVSVASATAASNTVPRSNVGDRRATITANELKPSECANLTLANKLVVSGTATGTSANDLMLGSNLADTIDGSGSRDCLVGGGDNDTLRGSGGDDVLLGGPGDDYLSGGAGTDVCYGGGGNDTFHKDLLILLDDCETRIQ
jgi:Ca2+-binding RTX toxin-like protein